MMQRKTVRYLVALTILALLGSSLLQRYVGHVMQEPDLDFLDYYFEAAMVHDHPRVNMYAPALGGNPQMRGAPSGSEVYERAEAAGFNGTNLYLYPPLLADLLSPLSRVSARQAAALWRGLNLLLVIAAMMLTAGWMGVRLLSAETALLVFAGYTFWPVHETIAQGQISIILLALWAVAIFGYAEGRLAISAIALALATWLKVTPVLILPVFFLWGARKDRRWISWYVLASGAMGVFVVLLNGFQNLALSLKVLMAMGSGVPALGNKSISSVVFWLHYGHPATIPEARMLINSLQPHGLMLLSKLVSVSFYALCLLLVWRSRRERTRDGVVVLAVFIFVIALVSPVSWRHGYSAGLVPLAILWIRALRGSESRVVHVWLLALTTVSVGSLLFDIAAQAPLPDSLRVICASTWPVFCALLCLEVLWHEASSGRKPPGSSARVEDLQLRTD